MDTFKLCIVELLKSLCRYYGCKLLKTQTAARQKQTLRGTIVHTIWLCAWAIHPISVAVSSVTSFGARRLQRNNLGSHTPRTLVIPLSEVDISIRAAPMRHIIFI